MVPNNRRLAEHFDWLVRYQVGEEDFTPIGRSAGKTVPTYTVGKRSLALTSYFVNDLQGRLLTRPQITADGFGAHTHTVPDAFGGQVDFAQLVKTFQSVSGNSAAVRYCRAR